MIRHRSPITARVARVACRTALPALAGCGGPTDPAPATGPDLLLLASPENNIFTADLYLVCGDGGGLRRLTTTAGTIKYSPRWSPDGRRVAWTQRAASGVNEGPVDVWVVDAAGAAPRQVTTTGDASVVRWLGPDRLAVSRASPAGGVVWYAVPVAGGAGAVIGAQGAGLQLFQPEWNADATKLAFAVPNGAAGGVVGVAAADGSAPRTLGSGFAYQWAPGLDAVAVFRPGAAGGPGVIALLAAGDGAATTVAQDTLLAGVRTISVTAGAQRAAVVRSGFITPTSGGYLRAFVTTGGGGWRVAYPGVPLGGSWYELEAHWQPVAR